MLNNAEYKARLKKVHPDYIQVTPKGNEKWREARVFWSVLYPDSANGDIAELASNFTAPCVLSPLHDKDLKDDSGEIKKAHYHFLVQYSGKKNPYQFYSDLVSCFGENAFSTVEIVGDIGYATRYLCHLDEDGIKKVIYNIDDLKCFGGFEVKKYLFEKTGDTMENVEKLMDLIDSSNFMFFNELAKYLRINDPVLFAGLIKDREVKNFVHNYLRGREHSLWYAGEVEKGYTKVHMDNGTDKVIFTRELKEA